MILKKIVYVCVWVCIPHFPLCKGMDMAQMQEMLKGMGGAGGMGG